MPPPALIKIKNLHGDGDLKIEFLISLNVFVQARP